MPSLHSQVIQQRQSLVARHREIQHRAGRVHAHLSYPLLLMPAFICGYMVVRAAPGFPALQGLTTLLSRLTHEFVRLNTAMQVLAPILLHPSVAPIAGTSGAPSSPTPADKELCQPPT